MTDLQLSNMARMSKISVFNIRKEKFAHDLIASGIANRWNKNDEHVIYSSTSRALSTLELVVHKASVQSNLNYKILNIELNLTEKDIFTVEIKDLPENWRSIQSYPILQNIGSSWYQSYTSLVLRVPSVIIPQEYNYILHTKHPLFKDRVHIQEVEDFIWDERLL